MRIKVLGGSGSEGPGFNLTGFLINGHTVLDAGTISAALSEDEQNAITHVILSHAHFDHIKALPFLIDNRVIGGNLKAPIQIMAAGAVIDTLRENLFNGKLWPDFSRIPSVKNPAVKYKKLAPGKAVRAGELSVRPFAVNHTVPTMGYIISENGAAILYSGDTKTTDEIWEHAAKLKDKLKAVFVETSFPNSQQAMADKTYHLTPRTLETELKKLGGYEGPVFLYHVKSQYLKDIKREIKKLGRDADIVKDGTELEI